MKRFLLTSAVLLTMLYGTSCLERIKKPFRRSGSEPKAGETDRAPKATPQVEVTRETEQEAARQEATIRRLENENQKQRLQLLEQETVIAGLEQQWVSHQRALDDVIEEVVRAKAKHSNPQDRARAASESAEAEIALDSLRREVSGAENLALAEAERLLARSAEEFAGGNFGGALFLTNQAKSRIRAGMDGLLASEPAERLDGETLFALPLALTLSKNSNLREGPGRDFEVLETLRKGAPVTGHSFKGSWLRVECPDGTSGWIHQSLLDAG